uniref:Uncharacterized protein n=1 Tax=Oryza barthii TaxID=65489 RepID=A0A0D3FSQ1_9ORYZ
MSATYDREAEHRALNATLSGVHGLVASGVTAVPSIFRVPDPEPREGSDKARLYSRDPARAAKYNCNFDLYQSPAANWRDMLYLRTAPDPPPAGDLPEYCR